MTANNNIGVGWVYAPYIPMFDEEEWKREEKIKLRKEIIKKILKGEEKMKSQELFTEMSKLWEEFELNHGEYTEKFNKAAALRARKAIGAIKNLITEYRKESVEETKVQK